MKITLRVLPALVLVLALALATGCGLIYKPDVPEDAVIETEPATPVSPVPPVSSAPPAPAEHVLKGWPAEYLPPGFPVYPNGVVAIVDYTKKHVSITLNETDEENLNSFTKVMEADGWEKKYTGYNNEYILSKDGMFLNVYPYIRREGQIGLLYKPINQDWWPVWPDMDWTDMPAALPEYPGGRINAIITGLEAVYVRIDDSSKAAFDNYFDDLVKAGWEYHSTDEDSNYKKITFKRDNWSVYLMYLMDDDLDDGEDNSRVDILAIIDECSDDDFAYDFRILFKVYSWLPL